MPSDYECENCGLNFTVGWYHYHERHTGFASRTFLVCTACGTIHAVEHPVRDAAVQEHYQSQKGPVFRPKKIGPLNLYENWLEYRDTAGLRLPDLPCIHCGKTGTLRNDWPLLGAPCPNCGTKIKASKASWRT